MLQLRYQGKRKINNLRLNNSYADLYNSYQCNNGFALTIAMKQITPIHLLRTFEAAARHCSFTLAAEELHITQAAISKQIKSLEKELHSKLFNRSAHGVSLTQSGERYWRDCRAFLSNIDNITSQLFSEGSTDTIRIRANISYGVDILAEEVKWFRTHYPDVTLELTHSVWTKKNQYDNADIEIDYRIIDSEQNDHYLLHRDQIFPLISKRIRNNQINALPTIHILGYYKEWNWWLNELRSMPNLNNSLEQWAELKQHEIKRSKNIIRVDNSLIAYKLCAQGIGCALGRSSLAKTYIDSGQLKRINQHSEFQAREGFHIYLTESGHTKQACCQFVDYLKMRTKPEQAKPDQH